MGRLCSVILTAVCLLGVHAITNFFQPNTQGDRRAFAGVGFASHNAPVMSFGGYNGQMNVVGYGPPIGSHLLRRRRHIETSDTMSTAVNNLIFRNDTMCLGLVVCNAARSDARDAMLLKQAFLATKDIRGVNFVDYAVDRASDKRETCEEAFAPCTELKTELKHALFNVLRVAANGAFGMLSKTN